MDVKEMYQNRVLLIVQRCCLISLLRFRCFCTDAEGLNVINDPEVLNVITLCPKCNKHLRVISFGLKWSGVMLTSWMTQVTHHYFDNGHVICRPKFNENQSGHRQPHDQLIVTPTWKMKTSITWLLSIGIPCAVSNFCSDPKK